MHQQNTNNASRKHPCVLEASRMCHQLFKVLQALAITSKIASRKPRPNLGWVSSKVIPQQASMGHTAILVNIHACLEQFVKDWDPALMSAARMRQARSNKRAAASTQQQARSSKHAAASTQQQACSSKHAAASMQQQTCNSKHGAASMQQRWSS